MAIQNELEDYVKKTLREQWTTRDGRVVPDTDDLALANVADTLEATVLYADLAGSTQMVDRHSWQFSAEIYKSFLYTASRLITHHGGTITAFDGDRVMGVFLGNSKNTNAAKTSLRINWAAQKVIQPAINAQYPSTSYSLQHRVGVDTSVIALWLGHQSATTTHIYLHADMTIKERALSRVPAANTTPGRYRPGDDLIDFLERL